MSRGKLILAVLCVLASGCGKDPPTSEQASVTAMNKGIEAEKSGDSALALEQLQKATMLDPGNHQAWHALGELHRKQQNWAMAADALDKAVALADNEPLYRQHLGVTLYERGDRQAARAQLDVARNLYEQAGGDAAEVSAVLERIRADDEREALEREARDAANRARIVDALGAQEGSLFSALTGSEGYTSSLDSDAVYGGLLGDAGVMQGGFGFARGDAGLVTGDPRRSFPRVRIGNAAATGDLDKNIIRRYIRRKLAHIKYCYEKHLLVKPDLKGTVTVNFEITPTGKVFMATASGVSDEVSSCVADVIKTIQFPEPKGGGVVIVKYPFTFRPK